MDDTNSKKILITGASGFIGGFLVKEALRRGYQVWAGVRKKSSRFLLQDTRIHFIDLKYDSLKALTEQLKEFVREEGGWDYVIHNAGLTKTTDTRLFHTVNAQYTHHLIEGLAASGRIPDKFILMSSLSSYGVGDEKTFRPICLSDPQQPNTEYGKSKLKAEHYLRDQSWFPYVILRPTGVYGPGERDYFVEIQSISKGFDFTAGLTPQRITFIYVKDLTRIAFMALEKEEIKNREYFVADGDVYTDSQFAQMIQKKLGKQRVFRARIPLFLVYIACMCSDLIGKLTGKSMTLNRDKYIILKQRNWICDITPLQDDLGFDPLYNLDKGLDECICWYKENKWL